MSVCHFSKAKEQWGEFGNMTGNFKFRISRDVLIPSTENLYQAMRFTDHPEIQKLIMGQKSGFGAKMVSKSYRKTHTREDFEDKKYEIMKWCLKLKLANHKRFGDALILTGNKDIVEESHKDTWWGAKLSGDTYTGINVLGQLLVEIREEYKNNLSENTREYKLIVPPTIENFNFFGSQVQIIDMR
jgi:ribA/ribD-fused uncharacterized protein